MEQIVLIVFGFIGGVILCRWIQDKSNAEFEKRLLRLKQKQDFFDKLPKNLKDMQLQYECMIDNQWAMICELNEDPNRVPPTLVELKEDLTRYCKLKYKGE